MRGIIAPARMDTRLLHPNELEIAITWLKQSQPVAIPTETVYGLAAPLFDPAAIHRVFALKGRPSDNPLIAHVASLAMVERIAERLPPSFYTLARTFWPGALTLVLHKRPEVPQIASAGQPTIAVRMPSHPVALALIERAGPLVAPSANRSGGPSPTTAAHVLEDLGGNVAAVIDGGACEIGIESTVLSLVHAVPTLLRPGAVTREALEQCLGVSIALPREGEPILSPGMKYRHYAPRARVRVTDDAAAVQGDFVLSREVLAPYMHRPLSARTLYASFREADRLGVSEIWVVLDAACLSDEALLNRIMKAAV